MFGRNSNALPYMNPNSQNPQNNGSVFSSYANNQSNFLNFQFQNQTINNNYPLIPPQGLTYNNQQPQQLIQIQPNPPTNRQNPDFEQFANMLDTIVYDIAYIFEDQSR